MKLAGGERDIVMELAKASLADRENANNIAGKQAIKLIEQITELIDMPIPNEEKLEKIRKIVFLLF